MSLTTTTTTNKALQEAQGVLKEIREKCARAFQDTKRFETEAKSVDLHREALEREVHTTCAECASLEEDCAQQEAFLALLPQRIQQSTVKSEEILQLWSTLDREITRVVQTSLQVETLKQTRLEQATQDMEAAKLQLHLLEVGKVKQLAQRRIHLDTASQRKSELEFQFTNEKNTLTCSERVAGEAQQFLLDKREQLAGMETDLAQLKLRDVLLPLAKQEELHVLHMENENRALDLAKREHAMLHVLGECETRVAERTCALLAKENELAACKADAEMIREQIKSKLAGFVLEEERLEDELVGLEREQEVLEKLEYEAKAEIATRMEKLKQDEENQVAHEVEVLERELKALAEDLRLGEEQQAQLARDEELVIKLHELAKQQIVERKAAEIEAAKAKEAELKAIAEREESQRLAKKEKEEAKRLEKALKKQEQARLQREKEDARLLREREEEELARVKREEEEEKAREKKQRLAAAEKEQAKAKKEEEEKAREKKQRLAAAEKEQAKAKKEEEEKARDKKQRAAAAEKARAEEAQEQAKAKKQMKRAEPVVVERRVTRALTARQDQQKPLKTRVAHTPPRPHRVQSTTPDWVRKQAASMYEYSPIMPKRDDDEEESDEEPVLPPPRRNNSNATYSRKSSLRPPQQQPPVVSKHYYDNNDSSSSASQFDLFNDDD